MSNKINSITCTVIFDGSALNRDEKIGNSILSIKKLTYHGDIRPYISKNAIRHYLFNTLHRFNNWGKTPIIAQGSGEKQTLQLDLSQADILSFEELAVFGYMFTKSGESALTRKSPLGITKAIALSSYNQDLSFYANHDFVNRVRESGRKTNPNPLNKEEHSGLFKLTFTIDVDMIGKDSWIVDDYSFDKDVLNVKIAEPQTFVIGNVERSVDEQGNESGYHVVLKGKKYPIIISGLTVTLPEELIKYDKNKILTIEPELASDRKEKTNKAGNKSFTTDFKFKITEAVENEYDGKKSYSFDCTFEPKVEEAKKADNDQSEETEPKLFTITLKSGFQKEIKQTTVKGKYEKKAATNVFKIGNEDPSEVKVTSLDKSKPENGPFKIEFNLSENKKLSILKQLLFAIKNGLVAQSSNELNTIKPLFILAGDVKVPMPVFHGDIDVRKDGDTLKVIGIKDAINNGWLNGNIFLHVSERLSAQAPNDERIETDWDKFLEAVGLS
jgi:CRISPR-associated protein Cas7/Cst2/DevR subtype I-B